MTNALARTTPRTVSGTGTVAFRALGPLEAMVSGQPVDLGAPKQRALLALLVSQVGQPVSVDVMLEALWEGHPPPSAMTSLQAYVANLRRLLEPDRPPRAPATVLRTCPQGYLLDGGVVNVDVCRFGEHTSAGWQAWDRDDPQQALREFDAGLALWRGQAYPEVAHAPCVLPETARLEELRLSVVEMRCAALLAVGSHEVAVAELGAFMQANPLREYGCELLSLALYRAGRQAEALEVLRTMDTRLTEELGLDPRPALQNLKHEILNQAPTLEWQPIPAIPSQTRSDEPASQPSADEEVFVGREAVLRQLFDALTATKSGRGRVVTVSGEQGIGKTSLLRRFATLAGVPVLWATGPEHVAAPPLWLWEEVLRAAATSLSRHEMPGPVAELLDANTQQAADVRRFEAIVQYLTDVSQAGPLVVVLDHLHRADASSLRLLAHLAESVPASRLLLVVSYRSDQAPVLAETLAALSRGEMTRIDVAGLDMRDIQTLASAVLHQEVSGHTAKGLWARTEGNPFFLRELIKLLTSAQLLDDPHSAPVPAPVRDVVLRRVARLPRATTEVLSVAAIAGRHFDIRVVAEVVAIEIDLALEVLDAAIDAGLIVEDQRRLGWFRFTHALVAEAIYETTGRLRRARLHRRIGAALEGEHTMSTTANSAHSDVPFLDVLDPDFDFGSPEAMAAQEKSWYADSPIGLLVLRHAEAQDLLRDRRLDHNGKGYIEQSGVFEGPIYDWFVPMINHHDGEHHRRLRGLVSKAFTPRMINELKPLVRAESERMAEEMAAARECDFVESFADPLPLAVMCRLLGVPNEDYDTFRLWTNDIGLVFSMVHGGDIVGRVEKAVVGLNEYVSSLMAEKARKPDDGLISTLVAAQRADSQVSEEEVLNLLVTLVFAAHDTTCHQLSNAMVIFSERPEQWNLLAERPELAPQAIEEIIRWSPSTPIIYRCAAEDFEYGGLHIEKGTFLTMCAQTAGRDPRVFANGDTFDITNTSTVPPLLFGAGPHFCLGAPLARAEMCEALPALVTRLGPPTIAGPVTWRPPTGIHGPNELPLRFERRQTARRG